LNGELNLALDVGQAALAQCLKLKIG
jgi:hypothetical protein